MVPNYTTREFTIPANGSFEIFREAEFLTCLEAEEAFELKIDGGSKFDFEAGLGLTTEGTFTRLEFLNTGNTSNKVRIGLGKGGVRDARLVISGTLNTKETTPDGFSTGSPVSALNNATTSLAAADPKRRELILVNDGAGKVYIGAAAGMAAGQGVPLDAGQTLVLQTTAPAFARNDSGAAVNVAVASVGWF